MSKAAGKGNRPNRAMPLSSEDEEQLWRNGESCLNNPVALLRTLFWFMTLFHGLRGQHEHHQMYWEDVELKEDSSGLQFLEFTKRLTKTRRRTNAGRAFSPRMFPAEDKISNRGVQTTSVAEAKDTGRKGVQRILPGNKPPVPQTWKLVQ